jgi:hypothetical protein
LLGDPPIDWDKVLTIQDVVKPAATRDRFAASLIRQEVLAKRRRALIIYGDMHFQRRDVMANFQELPGDDLLLSILEREARTRVFSVWTNTAVDLSVLDGGAATWPVPFLIPLPRVGARCGRFHLLLPIQGSAISSQARHSPDDLGRGHDADSTRGVAIVPNAGPVRRPSPSWTSVDDDDVSGVAGGVR